ncbi:MAG: energy-coupling factor transporter transmembrane protein EcfT, partial [bacterium]|nr:energy-coupling factor transporter transmembrane protein EcfT [bacterium]
MSALKNITIGQYFPGNSAVHKLDPRTKIMLSFAYIIGLFMVKTAAGYAVFGL